MPAMADVTLTHPDGHGPITVPEHRARILCRQGWQAARRKVANHPSDEATASPSTTDDEGPTPSSSPTED